MSKIIIGDKEQHQIYLYNYYFWQNTFTGTLRLFGGPMMILLAIWFYVTGTQNPIVYGSILLAYGLYYLLRPFISIYINREKLDFGVFEVTMSSVGINIESDNGLQTYEYTDFKKIAKYKQWYALYFDKKSVLVLPSNQLSKEEQEQLNKRVI
jgi:hypothetical protein